ncbi:hypothetical protein BC936DRAFT_137210 [Jimgerdemannia flammicorona]|uniref:Uncharacterized protein n=1 Tax=Jimgerdemannia flammicorona TaxID=994334 RepID=A0A433DJD8_9FUNG|nr:hypothetical protein BC936DRAFT_137210 [Jimgerdemannia flammicorona]
MNVSKFTQYFSNLPNPLANSDFLSAPTIDIPARCYPVDTFYLEDICDGLGLSEAHRVMVLNERCRPERRDAMLGWITFCHAAEPPGNAFLVFLPGIAMIAEIVSLSFSDYMCTCDIITITILSVAHKIQASHVLCIRFLLSGGAASFSRSSAESIRCLRSTTFATGATPPPAMQIIKVHSTVTIDEQALVMLPAPAGYRKVLSFVLGLLWIGKSFSISCGGYIRDAVLTIFRITHNTSFRSYWRPTSQNRLSPSLMFISFSIPASAKTCTTMLSRVVSV